PRSRIAREEMRDARIGEPEADDRQRRRDPLKRDSCAGRAGHQDVPLERYQFPRQGLEIFDRAIAIVDIHIATLRVAQAAQAIDEGGVVLLQAQRKERDARTGVGRAGVLRTRRERPRRRAAKQRDEIAPPNHSITSSARASSVGGTSRPSALAVLRLIISSTFVACCTGKSAGFSPLRIGPVWTPLVHAGKTSSVAHQATGRGGLAD